MANNRKIHAVVVTDHTNVNVYLNMKSKATVNPHHFGPNVDNA